MVKEYTAHKRKLLHSSLESGKVCCVCKRSILQGEKYYKTGHRWIATQYKTKGHHPIVRLSTEKTYCSECVNTVYVDGDEV